VKTVPAFDTFIAIDWSGAAKNYDGIAVAACREGQSSPKLIVPKHASRWTRSTIADWLCRELSRRRRLLIGMDFAFAFPFEDHGYLGGEAQHLESVFDLWRLINKASPDLDFGCESLIGHPRYARLFWKSGPRPEDWIESKRRTERACAEQTKTRPETVYKLVGSKQVGKASITGIRVLHHIRSINRDRVAFWPFEKTRESVIVEIYPTLFRKWSTGSLAKLRSIHDLNRALTFFDCDSVRYRKTMSDHEGDALISAAALRAIAREPAAWSHREIKSPRVQREGWIFGVRGIRSDVRGNGRH
jgi:hypothetical protein